jgi:ABC-type branched-subunit amino acid transport system ATPase component
MTDILHASRISKRFGGLLAVGGIDFTIPERAIVSLIGPNGAGKTTFFNIIAGIYDPTAGEIEFRGRRMIWTAPGFAVAILSLLILGTQSDTSVIVSIGLTVITLMLGMLIGVSRPPWYQHFLIRLGMFKSGRPNDMVVAGLGRTFQNIRLFQNMTALENVQVGMHTKLGASWLDAMFSTPRDRHEEAESRERAKEFLALVGLKGRDDQLAKNLPYGDQRRLEVARALASKPVLLLLDEPTAGMNPRETQQLTDLIGRLRNDLNLTVLLIEHDMRVVMGISDRVTVLDHGEKIAEGTPDEVRKNPRVIEAYLGRRKWTPRAETGSA